MSRKQVSSSFIMKKTTVKRIVSLRCIAKLVSVVTLGAMLVACNTATDHACDEREGAKKEQRLRLIVF